MKIISLASKVFALVFFTLFLAKTTNAANDYQFSIDYSINYTVLETGETSVLQKTIITNLVNEVIPTTYTFSAKQMKIYNVSAETNGKSSVVNTEETKGDTLISVTISNYFIGKGRQNEINLKYITRSIAQKNGNIWNINIPKIQVPETTTLYDVHLSIPASFGPKIYLSPTPITEKRESNATSFSFNKGSFTTSSITAAFGEYQPVNFKLKYQLNNSFVLPLLKEIALPPDIGDAQEVSYQSINPKPLTMKTDKDGNTIAIYILSPLKKIEIEVIGTAKLFGKQINPEFGKNFTDLPKNLVNMYTKPRKYWESDSTNVEKVAKELKDEKSNVIKNAQKIYNFITNNLSYNFGASQRGLVERQGAETILSTKGSWTCMEFTDLFIAVARAVGIPAREVNGYAFTGNDNNRPLSISLKGGDFLHAWPEFYDSYYGWIQVDPTWGTTSGVDYFTKLDMSHFAFVIKGVSSEYPFSAGTYRFSNNGNEKLIDVALSQSISEDNFKPKLIVTKAFNWNPLQLILGKEKYRMENKGGITLYNLVGKTLNPGMSKYIYLGKETREIQYTDIRGNNYKTQL